MSAPPVDLSEQIARLGKGLVQINMRLTQVLEGVERAPSPAGPEARSLETMLDLVDATGEALERRQAMENRGRGWWARLFGRGDESEDLWRGIAMARASALERLRSMGIEPIPATGAFDPSLHHAVDTRPAPSPELVATIAAAHRRGWMRVRAQGREAIREAQVSVFERGEGGS